MCTFDENTVSDLHKDAYGFRPREQFWSEWNSASNDLKQIIWNDLLVDLERAIELEDNQKLAAINAFELEIATAIDLGASSRDDAVRWVVQSMDLDDIDLMHGGSYICYIKDLPYSMSPMFDNVINHLNYEVI